MKPFILSITGKKGCGKDTLANIIKTYVEPMDFKVEIRPMAAYLKDVLAVMLNTPRDRFEDRDFKESLSAVKGWGTNREVMQNVGQALRDSFISTVWIDLWLRDYYASLGSGNLESPPDLIIVPDIRMDNEAEMVKELGGIVVKLEYGILAEKIYEHKDNNITERGISKTLIDYTVGTDAIIKSMEGSVFDMINWDTIDIEALKDVVVKALDPTLK